MTISKKDFASAHTYTMSSISIRKRKKYQEREREWKTSAEENGLETVKRFVKLLSI